MKKLIPIMTILAMGLGPSGLAVAQTMEEATLPCDVSVYRQEQQQLVQYGYPTPVSERARECERLGLENPYPYPAYIGPDGTVYSWDPVEGQYLYLDSATGQYYMLDPATGIVTAYY